MSTYPEDSGSGYAPPQLALFLDHPLSDLPDCEAVARSWRVVGVEDVEDRPSNCALPRQPSIARKSGAVSVVRTGGDRKQGQSVGAEPTALAMRHCPTKPLTPRASAKCLEIDSQLALIIAAWPRLPQAIRAAMLAMIETLDRS